MTRVVKKGDRRGALSLEASHGCCPHCTEELAEEHILLLHKHITDLRAAQDGSVPIDPIEAVSSLIRQVDPDPNREGLHETPTRYVRALQFWTSGYQQDPLDVLKTFHHQDSVQDGMVFQASIPTYSLCEHHMATFFGVTHIGYIPQGKVVGLSKMSRLVDIYARRLQIQERLCGQVADALVAALEPKGVGVVMQMRHMCMESRGVCKPGTVTVTSTLRGCMLDDPTARAEFMAMVTTATQGLRAI